MNAILRDMSPPSAAAIGRWLVCRCRRTKSLSARESMVLPSQANGLVQTGLPPGHPVIVVAGHFPLGAAKKLGCLVPGYGPLVQQTPGSGQQGLLRSRRFTGRGVVPEGEAPKAGEENAR